MSGRGMPGGRDPSDRAERLAVWIFWTAAATASWVMVGYPLALALRRPRSWRRGHDLPSVTLIIPAYREREALREKLAALTALDYPRDRLELIVAVDADAELARIAAAAPPAPTVLFSPEREGKATALNRALQHAHGEVVVMTDANNVLAPDSIRACVRHLADPTVWAVAGRRGESGSLYARYEDLVRRLEARSGSVAGISGELIAVRRDRMPRFSDSIVNDDLWLLCQLVRAGGRVVYEPSAASTEESIPAGDELARRARISAGRVLLLGELIDLPPAYALRIASHKLGRLGLPALLSATLLSSLALSARRRYRAAAAAQLIGWAPGLASLLGLPLPGRAGGVARASRELLIGNAGVAIGAVRGLRGHQSVRWEPVR